MSESDRMTKAIEENATSSQSVSSAAGSQTSHALDSQIKADKYLASKRAAQNGVSGLRIMQRWGNTSG